MSVTVVYRSAADLKKSEFWYEEGPKMQERAIKAEAENAKLRRVVDAAREWINCPCEDIRECSECTACKFHNALAELDKEDTIE